MGALENASLLEELGKFQHSKTREGRCLPQNT